jgi:cbb3-type cytochrome c oxidase subunit II
MKNLEKFSTIFLIGGFFFFVIAFLFLGLWPSLMTDSFDETAGYPEEIPADFKQYYSSVEDYHAALRTGRDIYVKEACWHCHSQYVRPVGSESMYYGAVSTPGEYENELNRPQLFGTRRVGPDLTREGGKRSNDWHFAHLYNPKYTEPESVMPVYPWYFDETTDPPTPTDEGIALVAYLQNLGVWAREANREVHDLNEITMPPQPEE